MKPRALPVVPVNILLVVFVIVLIEAIFGSWFNPENLNRLNLIRDARILYKVDNLYNWPDPYIIYTRDKYGLRGSFASPNEVDILTVGGSTTDQRYISDGYTWQDVIQKEFDKVGAKVVVANAGVDGQSTFGHIKNFDWWFNQIPELRPGFILFYVGLNDFYKDTDYEYDDLVANDNSIKQLIKERSVFYYLYRTIKAIYKAHFVYEISHTTIDFGTINWTEKPLLGEYPDFMHDRLTAYAARLEQLIKRTRDFGSQPIFVTQPSREYRFNSEQLFGVDIISQYENVRFNGVDFYHMMRSMDDILLQTCKNNNVLCFDLSRDLATRWEDQDFYDFGHMTPNGAKKVGLYLYQKLKEHM